MKMILTNIKRYTQDKNGNPLKTKDGKPYTRLNIQVKEFGEKWISGFGNARNANWQNGEEVDIEVKQNGEYLNFEMPKPVVMGAGVDQATKDQLLRIELSLEALKTGISGILAILQTKASVSTDDMPFDDAPLPEEEI